MLSTAIFKQHIRTENLFRETDRLLLAVSGGVDSAVLCNLCAEAGYTFEIAHVNFGLRGPESEADEQFVRSLAAKYGVPVHVKTCDTEKYAALKRVSVQVAAREIRYSWFAELLSESRQWLLTAHHAGDNIETMVMNFFRGTGIRGLHGILPKQQKIIRPMLSFTKADILLFARENNLEWREDRTNITDKYTRNYFRHHVIPMVAKVYLEVENNLEENITRFREVEQLYDQAIAVHKKALLEFRGNEVHIPVLKLKASVPLSTIVYEIVKEYHFGSMQVPEVIGLFDAAQGKFVQSSTHRIIKNRKWLIIANNQDAVSEHIIIEEENSVVAFANGILECTALPAGNLDISPHPLFAYMDLSELSFPLILRKRKAGDYFYPLGMPKKKKISRFLIDQKISPTAKENTWVLESANRICWVAGMRIDHRFRVKESTSNVLRIQLKKS